MGLQPQTIQPKNIFLRNADNDNSKGKSFTTEDTEEGKIEDTETWWRDLAAGFLSTFSVPRGVFSCVELRDRAYQDHGACGLGHAACWLQRDGEFFCG